jgi:Asp-tRNA(Asn)/Glu-tRNA(Gln) amidotransferase A subunit family amidase
VDDYLSGLLPAEQLDAQLLKGKTLGVVKQTMGDGVDPSVKAAVTAACAHMESLGATVRLLASHILRCPTLTLALQPREEAVRLRVGVKQRQKL